MLNLEAMIPKPRLPKIENFQIGNKVCLKPERISDLLNAVNIRPKRQPEADLSGTLIQISAAVPERKFPVLAPVLHCLLENGKIIDPFLKDEINDYLTQNTKFTDKSKKILIDILTNIEFKITELKTNNPQDIFHSKYAIKAIFRGAKESKSFRCDEKYLQSVK